MLKKSDSPARRQLLSAISVPALTALSRVPLQRLLLGTLGATALSSCASSNPALTQNVKVAPPPRVRVRDRWRYVGINRYNQLPIGELQTEVVENSPILRVRNQYSDGRSVPDDLYSRAWDVVQQTHYDLTEQFAQPVPILPARLEPGGNERVRTSYRAMNTERNLFWTVFVDARNWERIRVPAGEFDCLRVERRIWFSHSDVFRNSSERYETLWYSPDVNCWVQREWTGNYLVPGGRRGSRFREDWVRWQLLDHIPAPVSS